GRRPRGDFAKKASPNRPGDTKEVQKQPAPEVAKRAAEKANEKAKGAVAKSGESKPSSAATSKSAMTKAPEQKTAPAKAAPAPFVDVPTELDQDRKPAVHTGGDVFIKDATILTVSHGTIPKGSILVEKGKIKAVGTGLSAPA